MTDKNRAQQYLIDPFNEPTPAEDTGLIASPARPICRAESSGRHDTPVATNATGSSTTTNPFRRSASQKVPSTRTRQVGRGSPSTEAFPSLPNGGSPSSSHGHRRNVSEDMSQPRAADGALRRGSSLRERYPGDKTVHPLEILKHENKLANRSPHLRKKHIPGADIVDQLDNISSSYHHEGPYDAALLARNNSFDKGPLGALHYSNSETLKATPPENIQDSVERHRPLDGVAIIPPGGRDRYGRVYNYEEGTDMMREPGADYKRWPDIDYLPEDLKGKGEPSFSIERALKKQEEVAKLGQDGTDIEMMPQNEESQSEDARPAKASSSGSHKFGGEMKRRLGSLRKKEKAS